MNMERVSLVAAPEPWQFDDATDVASLKRAMVPTSTLLVAAAFIFAIFTIGFCGTKKQERTPRLSPSTR